MQISRLRVANEDFLVSSIIERCPKAMMLRELVKNALESAARSLNGGYRVEIARVIVGGAPKLSIWNTGPGMDAAELWRMCDIASSIGKQNGLDENFGMGAKVASLPANPLGIRYRSCKAGRVHQVVMGRRDGRYGRLHQTGADGEMADIVDATQDALADGRSTDFDWTEVVLFGAIDEQDTVIDPYGGNPSVPAGWITADLHARFYALPEGIELVLRAGCDGLVSDRFFTPIGNQLGSYARHEAVKVAHGTIVHYIYDPIESDHPGRRRSDRGAPRSGQNSAGLIYRDEIYDLRPNWAWMHEAPVFGIPFGAKNISIYIQLPSDYPALPDAYRQFLRHKDNLQHHVQVREFAELALRHRPDWLIALLRDLAPDAGPANAVQEEMTILFRSLGIRRQWWPPMNSGNSPSASTDSVAEASIEYETSPQIVPLRDQAEITDRGMGATAARFYRETHQLFVNTTYSGFSELKTLLEQDYAAAEDQDRVRSMAMMMTEKILMRQIGRKLVFALAKRGVWGDSEIEQATSMYSLTLAADDYVGLLANARDEMACALAPAPASGAYNEIVGKRYEAAMSELLAIRSQQLKNLLSTNSGRWSQNRPAIRVSDTNRRCV